MRVFLFLFLLNIFPMNLIAKSGTDHEYDQLYVLGFWNNSNWFHKQTSKKNREIMRPLLVLINDMIDDPNKSNTDIHGTLFYKKYYKLGQDKEFYHQIQEKFPNFTWGEYTHRLFYHWGFEYNDPANQDKLKQQFEKLSYATDDKWNEFLQLIMDEQGKRNRAMISATNEFFGLGGDRAFSRGIAGILYYTHLLGDLIEHSNESTAEAVLSSKNIAKRIEQYVKELATHGNQKEYQQYKLYQKQVLFTSYSCDEQYAQAMIDMLAEYVPKLLNKNLKNTIEKKGLKFLK